MCVLFSIIAVPVITVAPIRNHRSQYDAVSVKTNVPSGSVYIIGLHLQYENRFNPPSTSGSRFSSLSALMNLPVVGS